MVNKEPSVRRRDAPPSELFLFNIYFAVAQTTEQFFAEDYLYSRAGGCPQVNTTECSLYGA